MSEQAELLPTPRTDAIWKSDCSCSPEKQLQELARTLERELATRSQPVEQLRKALEWASTQVYHNGVKFLDGTRTECDCPVCVALESTKPNDPQTNLG